VRVRLSCGRRISGGRRMAPRRPVTGERSTRPGAVLVSARAVRWCLTARLGVTWRADFAQAVLCFDLAAARPVVLARLLGDYFISAVAEAGPAASRLEFEDAYCQVSEPFAELDPEGLQHWNEKEEGRSDDFRAG